MVTLEMLSRRQASTVIAWPEQLPLTGFFYLLFYFSVSPKASCGLRGFCVALHLDMVQPLPKSW